MAEAEASAEEVQVAAGNDSKSKAIRADIPSMFFSKKEKEEIMEAIAKAEANTSGEIRIHVSKGVKGDIYEEGKKVFEKIGMTHTKHRNGVLIFFAIKNRSFVILGDSGIDGKIESGVWDEIASKMQERFIKNDFVGGMIEGISMVGNILSAHFEYEKDAENELTNEISTD